MYAYGRQVLRELVLKVCALADERRSLEEGAWEMWKRIEAFAVVIFNILIFGAMKTGRIWFLNQTFSTNFKLCVDK